MCADLCMTALGPDGSRSESERVQIPRGFEVLKSDGFPPGLRGLNNLGNTCFMNSVLQAMLHTPLLQSFYLLLRHTRGSCPISLDAGHCMTCELDEIFRVAFSGRREGFSPTRFLLAWWTLIGGHMAGSQQQDAHEFFLFMLEMLVSGSQEGPSASVPRQVFEGRLSSRVVCGSCGHCSVARDPFTHLSLDIPAPGALLPPPLLPRGGGFGGRGGGTSGRGRGGGRGGRGPGKPPRQAPSAAGPTAPSRAAEEASAMEAGSSQDLSALPQGSTGEESASAQQEASDEGAARPKEEEEDSLCSPRTKGLSLWDGGGGDDAGLPFGVGGPQASGASEAESLRRMRSSAASPASPSAAGESSNGHGALPSNAALLAGFMRWPGASLLGCLRRFVRAEVLGEDGNWRCQRCDGRKGAVKHLQVERLPPVLVLHAKRFEHSGGHRGVARKLETYVAFPLDNLDMWPFTARGTEGAGGAPEAGHASETGHVSGTSAAPQADALPGPPDPPPRREDYAYSLYAVICHKGSFQGGHYVTYVRPGDGQWYLCDDGCVSACDESVVRHCQAYMLFYARSSLLGQGPGAPPPPAASPAPRPSGVPQMK